MKALQGFLAALLLANALLFAYGRGWITPPSGGGEPQRLAAQVFPEKIKLVAAGQPPAASVAPAAGTALACRSITGLAPDEAASIVAQLKQADAELEPVVRLVEEAPSSFWVFIRPEGTTTTAVIAELRRLGIQDFQVMSNGSGANSISLGLFRSRQGAEQHLEELQRKGVRSAKLEPRPGAQRATLELRAPEAKLARLQVATIPTGAVLGECAAGSPRP